MSGGWRGRIICFCGQYQCHSSRVLRQDNQNWNIFSPTALWWGSARSGQQFFNCNCSICIMADTFTGNNFKSPKGGAWPSENMSLIFSYSLPVLMLIALDLRVWSGLDTDWLTSEGKLLIIWGSGDQDILADWMRMHSGRYPNHFIRVMSYLASTIKWSEVYQWDWVISQSNDN